MTILVFSDSHGTKNGMLDAVQLESPSLILHLGDSIRDCTIINTAYPEVPLRSVKGNCDYGSAGLDMDEFVFGGKRFFMTHGHLFGVKTGKVSVINAATYRAADVLLFGHTHIPYYSVLENLTIVNPGSIGSGDRQYAVLEIKNGVILCELKRL